MQKYTWTDSSYQYESKRKPGGLDFREGQRLVSLIRDILNSVLKNPSLPVGGLPCHVNSSTNYNSVLAECMQGYTSYSVFFRFNNGERL